MHSRFSKIRRRTRVRGRPNFYFNFKIQLDTFFLTHVGVSPRETIVSAARYRRGKMRHLQSQRDVRVFALIVMRLRRNRPGGHVFRRERIKRLNGRLYFADKFARGLAPTESQSARENRSYLPELDFELHP